MTGDERMRTCLGCPYAAGPKQLEAPGGLVPPAAARRGTGAAPIDTGAARPYSALYGQGTPRQDSNPLHRALLPLPACSVASLAAPKDGTSFLVILP